MTHKKAFGLARDYVKGRLLNEERVGFEKHVGLCRKCAAKLTSLLVRVDVVKNAPKIKKSSR
ncbi:MAG: hypothetical protein Q8P07_04955 [bacterium]|nr:hypothetical protein [bacterium]